MKKENYKDILKDISQESTAWKQMDLTAGQSSKKVPQNCNNMFNKPSVLKWPSQSPDLKLVQGGPQTRLSCTSPATRNGPEVLLLF